MKLRGKTINSSYHIFGFLLFWGILNVTSAYYTGLAHDEAYYWMFSQHLDWGYLDHPPMVAVLIWLGQQFFDNNLGVRFFNIFLNLASLYLLWNVCKVYGRDLCLFMAMYVGLITFHVYAFITVPDSPLLAACVLYFWVLRRYLERENVYNSLLLVLAIAFMLYSKYHGFLILIFTIASHPKLLLKKSFWWICFGSVLFFFPHILWEYNHDWPTYTYHFLGRGNLAYHLRFTTNYVLGILLITGPLLCFVLWYAFFKASIESKWERVLKVNVLGFALFFFLASFRSKIEPNWNSPLLIPLFIISYKYIVGLRGPRKLTIVLGALSFALCIFFRVYAANDFIYSQLSTHFKPKNEFHLWDKWASELSNISSGKPAVFMDSYQQASKYAYYNREPSYSYNSVYHRKNQYDLWDTESQLQGKEVVVFSKVPRKGFVPVPTVFGDYYSKQLKKFRSYNKVRIVLLDEKLKLVSGEKRQFHIKLTNDFPYPVTFREDPASPTSIVISVFQHKKLIDQQEFVISELAKPLAPGESMDEKLTFKALLKPGDYFLFISIKTGFLEPGINSGKIALTIK